MNYPPSWNFNPPPNGKYFTATLPEGAWHDFYSLAVQLSSASSRSLKSAIEAFGRSVGARIGRGYLHSSDEGFALGDVADIFRETKNPIHLMAGFFEAAGKLADDQGRPLFTGPGPFNALLAKHDIGYIVEADNILLRDGPILESVPPPSELEQLSSKLAAAWRTADALYVEGKHRQAVGEIWWVVESIVSEFEGIPVEGSPLRGEYFNDILRSLRKTDQTAFFRAASRLSEHLHGFLSSPKQGGVRHGAKLAIPPMDPHEARLMIEVARGLAGYFCEEYRRMTQSSK